MAVTSGLNSKRKAAQAVTFSVKQERNVMLKKVYTLLKKTEVDRSEEEKQFLFNYIDLVKEVTKRIDRQKKLKERLKEVEDPPDVVAEKCVTLAEALSACKNLVVYTGAGVSTAARIPDYRGANGIWTLLQQGKDIGLHDLSKADPTLTHMALYQLHRMGMVKHVVSQNCDGLHLRSGLPKEAISEVHGNMYIEVCRQCQPVREFWRLFDVTENTARFSHRTGRRCYMCSGALVDSIVHFGERGTLKWPLNWPGTVSAAEKADAILCIGSSLKVLKKYPWLWCMDKHPKKRPKLYIVNLQWTPKDDQAVLKINARCDDVMREVMNHLRIPIPTYDRSRDPMFFHSTPLHPGESHTTSKPFLDLPEGWSALQQKDTKECEEVGKEGNSGIVNCRNRHSVKDERDVSSQSICVKQGSRSAIPMRGKEGSHECLNDDNEKLNVKTERMSPVENASYFEHSKKPICDSQHVGSASRKGKISECTNILSLDLPSMEIIYEGVKLKVGGNISVPANVKINNDLAILCDMSSITCNSFMLNTSYELDEVQRTFHCVRSSAGGKELDRTDGSNVTASFPSPEHNYSQSFSCIPSSSVTSDVLIQSQSSLQPSSSSRTVLKKEVKEETKSPIPRCSFCTDNYQSAKCLFYPPYEPVFINSSVGICECCSEGSGVEEEEEEEVEEENDDAEKKEPAKPVTNPGWYGKGYRRRFKKKR